MFSYRKLGSAVGGRGFFSSPSPPARAPLPPDSSREALYKEEGPPLPDTSLAKFPFPLTSGPAPHAPLRPLPPPHSTAPVDSHPTDLPRPPSRCPPGPALTQAGASPGPRARGGASPSPRTLVRGPLERSSRASAS